MEGGKAPTHFMPGSNGLVGILTPLVSWNKRTKLEQTNESFGCQRRWRGSGGSGVCNLNLTRKSKHGAKKDPLLSLCEFAFRGFSPPSAKSAFQAVAQISPEPERNGSGVGGGHGHGIYGGHLRLSIYSKKAFGDDDANELAPPFIAMCFRHFHCFRST